ncbi:MAG: glycoside hydrolase family 3 C-terminal domain-containing protein [Alistipes sp.]|nr:glycoside hydrolase family 3 C-terminal domain-containing protein [Alistipes sp.]
MKRVTILVAALAMVWTASAQQKMSWDDAYAKADEIISRLTVAEKLEMTHGYRNFFFNGVPEKGVPYVFLSDASQGVCLNRDLRGSGLVEQLDKSTAFPAPIMLSATFDPALAYDYAEAVGEECQANNVKVLLGPGLNIYRNSQCGRNYEYFGEDPFLTSRMTENYVRGIQSTGTAACIKHFLGNSTEFYRRRSNSVIDERALHEIYMPGFKAGVDAGVATVMTAYNQLNGEWCGQNRYVITDLLRGELGFRGGVVSDWSSTYDWEKIIRSGQNIDMGGTPKFYIEKVAKDLYAEGRVSEREIEDMIRPIIATSLAFGLYEPNNYAKPLDAMFARSAEVAYRVACEGAVLLKNDGILPIDAAKRRNILLTGRFATECPRGKGSAEVIGFNSVTMTDALREKFGNDLTVAKNPTAEMIAAADVVILSVGTIDAESTERPFALPSADENFIRMCVENNPNTVVVVNSGSGIRMTGWADKAAAILYDWYPGQNGLTAMADILVGRINPSGKLPMTIEKNFSDSPAKNSVPKGAKMMRNVNEYFFRVYDVNYDESVLVGYRWYETKGIEPLYPFGFGLSYTTFSLGKAKLSAKSLSEDKPLKVSVMLTNTGDREGAEVIQLYVSEKHPTVLRPKKELKGFRKVTLAPKAKTVVEFEVERKDLAFWCDKTHDWKVNAGEYVISLGTSSADIACELAVAVE